MICSNFAHQLTIHFKLEFEQYASVHRCYAFFLYSYFFRLEIILYYCVCMAFIFHESVNLLSFVESIKFQISLQCVNVI